MEDSRKEDNLSCYAQLQRPHACERVLTPTSGRVFQARMKEDGEFNKPVRLSLGTRPIKHNHTLPIQKMNDLDIALTPQQKVLKETFKKYQQKSEQRQSLPIKSGNGNQCSTHNSIQTPDTQLKKTKKQKTKKNCCFFI